MFTYRELDVRGVATNVGEAGSGPDVVLLHGNPDTHSVWSRVVERLHGAHHCITPDLPGFGKSKAPDDFDCSMESQAAWVTAFFDAMKLDRAHLVVHDIGGPYGLAFACEHPERLLSLTIFNTIFFPDYTWHFWARAWRRRVIGEIVMAIANRPLFVREMKRGSPQMPKDYANHAYAEFGKDAKRLVLKWYRAMPTSAWAGWGERLVAATANTPKLVMWGDADPFIPSATADRFGTTNVQHVADCGHWLMVENPDLAATSIAKLIAG